MHDTHGLPVNFVCKDGTSLGAHLWPSATGTDCGTVIINAATGVPARYYHRYARFLSEHGFTVLTYDYRGIGLSRPASLRGYACRWADWGERDFSAAIDFIRQRQPGGPLVVVGHSIGGFLPGLAENAPAIDRMLTVGAQYGYCADYAAVHRWRLFLKWHVAMPVLTAALGYFPGKRLGWLEDLPAGVAKDWSFRRARMELSHPPLKSSGDGQPSGLRYRRHPGHLRQRRCDRHPRSHPQSLALLPEREHDRRAFDARRLRMCADRPFRPVP